MTKDNLPKSSDEVRFLRGPKKRRTELLLALRIFFEFIRGFRKLHFAGPCVTVFGSARFTDGHRYYELGERAGARLAKMGFTVLTGGGPGLMEAANKGASDVGGRTMGCAIELPFEQAPNEFCNDTVSFKYFFVRKVMLIKYSYAFVVLPGGFGTMDEVFETLTLRQTKKIDDFPVVLLGTEYWGPLLQFVDEMVERGTIAAEDLEMVLVTDDLDEMVHHIEAMAVRRFGLEYRPPIRRLPILGEG